MAVMSVVSTPLGMSIAITFSSPEQTNMPISRQAELKFVPTSGSTGQYREPNCGGAFPSLRNAVRHRDFLIMQEKFSYLPSALAGLFIFKTLLETDRHLLLNAKD